MTPHIRLRLANKGRGDFRAQGSDLWLYDTVAANDDEAEWMGGVSPARFAAALAAMPGPVRLRVNSPGGDVFAGMAMAQAIREHPAPVVAQVDGLAASIATVIIAAAAETVMARGAMLMVHRAWSIAMGDAEDFMRLAATLEKVDGQIAGTYAARSGGAVDDWTARMAAETWMDADEAVSAGLADRVLDAEARPAALAAWDLSAYAATPDCIAAAAAADEAARADAARRRKLVARVATGTI